MTELLTQEQVEARMYYGGIKRAENMMQRAEEKGRAVTNPYASSILREYVLPLAEALKQELADKRAGRQRAHVQLLQGLDLDTVALLAVRTALNTLLHGFNKARQVGYEIGKMVHSELVLIQIEEHNPELYRTLVRDFGRRMSKDVRHRMTVFKMQAKAAGIEVVEWPTGARDQVGLYLLDLLQQAGMVEVGATTTFRGKTEFGEVMLSQQVIEQIDSIKAYVAVTMPVYGPCVAPPRDWTNAFDGGFHTKELRRAQGGLVRHRRTSATEQLDMPVVLQAVNTLQRTAWQVNTRILDTVLEVAKHYSVGEVTSLTDLPKPSQPAWLQKDTDTEKLSEEQTDEFKKWKRSVAEWHTQRKLLATRYGRFYSATRAAEMFRAYPAIYFVHFADTRGRLYPMTYGLNPQGSDLQKALIRFSKGLPLDTPDAIRWFHVHGANKWGFDKATLKERQQWVVDRQDLLISFADDPINNNEWRNADKPLQFLAWCFEYAQWCRDDKTFVSHIPISMDGSCNGLQNLSALLRDEVGGRATNLTANEQMQDIYKLVAEAATLRLQALIYDDPDKEALRQKWLAHGLKRDVVKRSVMTTPYGVTKRSAVDYIIKDYLEEGKATVFDKKQHFAAACILMDAVWPAIGDVVIKGREAMDWLKKSAKLILNSLDKEAEPVITWISPSGFTASQSYFEVEAHRIRCRLHGPTSIKVPTETDTADTTKHSQGLAPNFVHSMDAAHLHLTASQCAQRGIDAVAMIHDDYGTHAANAQLLFTIIREVFVQMYEQHDPLADFAALYPGVPPLPSKGTLDIREVLRSPYFFS